MRLEITDKLGSSTSIANKQPMIVAQSDNDYDTAGIVWLGSRDTEPPVWPSISDYWGLARARPQALFAACGKNDHSVLSTVQRNGEFQC